MEKVGIGIIGCGNISGAYLKAMTSAFPILEIRGLADLNRELAEAKANEFNLHARSVEELLADPKVEIIVNLTIPKAHVAVGLQALEAGKHTYSEKPLGINFAEGKNWRMPPRPRACASALPLTPSSAAAIRPPAR